MIMIDTIGPNSPESEGDSYIFVIVDAVFHYVTTKCAPKNNAHYPYTALFEHWFMRLGIFEENRYDSDPNT